MPKLTTQVNGVDVEVEVPADFVKQHAGEVGLLTREQAEAAANDRAAKARKAAEDALLKDEGFRAKALSQWNIATGGAPAGTTDPNIMEKAQQAWIKEHLEPTQRELEQARQKVTALTQERLKAQIVTAASRYVNDALLKPATEGAQPAVVAMFSHVFGMDEQTGQFFVRDGDGFAMALSPSKQRLYMDVDEFFDRWSRDPANAQFLRQSRQGGPGLGDGRSSGGTVTLSRADAKNAKKYQEAHKRAKETGATVVYTD